MYNIIVNKTNMLQTLQKTLQYLSNIILFSIRKHKVIILCKQPPKFFIQHFKYIGLEYFVEQNTQQHLTNYTTSVKRAVRLNLQLRNIFLTHRIPVLIIAPINTYKNYLIVSKYLTTSLTLTILFVTTRNAVINNSSIDYRTYHPYDPDLYLLRVVVTSCSLNDYTLTESTTPTALHLCANIILIFIVIVIRKHRMKSFIDCAI